MADTARNLRYLLWKYNIPLERWPDQMATWAGNDLLRAASLLEGATPSEVEVSSIANAVDEELEEIVYSDLVARDGVDVLRENLQYLLSDLSPSRRKELSQEMSVAPSTVHRWLSGERRPRPQERIMELHHALGIPREVDLTRDPVFLDTIPMGVSQRRAWVKAQVDGLDPQTLNSLFPALQRLLRER